MNRKEWLNIKECGKLYIEKVLITFDIPILFVCSDYEGRKYLCMNIDPDTGETVIAHTDNTSLIGMLENCVTMETVFRESNDGRIMVVKYDEDNGRIITETRKAQNIDADYLPRKGAYFDLSGKEISDYVETLKKQIATVMRGTFNESRTMVIKSANDDNSLKLNGRCSMEYNMNVRIDSSYRPSRAYRVNINSKMIA